MNRQVFRFAVVRMSRTWGSDRLRTVMRMTAALTTGEGGSLLSCIGYGQAPTAGVDGRGCRSQEHTRNRDDVGRHNEGRVDAEERDSWTTLTMLRILRIVREVT